MDREFIDDDILYCRACEHETVHCIVIELDQDDEEQCTAICNDCGEERW